MKKIIFLLISMITLSPLSFATETFITNIYQNGRIIETPEYLITVYSWETNITSLWLPTNDIIITEQYIINKDGNEKVEIEYIDYK